MAMPLVTALGSEACWTFGNAMACLDAVRPCTQLNASIEQET